LPNFGNNPLIQRTETEHLAPPQSIDGWPPGDPGIEFKINKYLILGTADAAATRPPAFGSTSRRKRLRYSGADADPLRRRRAPWQLPVNSNEILRLKSCADAASLNHEI